jgi:hypothetical protein
VRETVHHPAKLLPALDDLVGPVWVRDRVDAVERRGGPPRTIAVEVGGEVVSDPDQPRAQRPSVRLASRPFEVPVGLEKGLLGEVLRVVMVADPVVRVGIDVAQVGSIQVLEGTVELGL